MTEFAAAYPRTPEGWIDFPEGYNEQSLRRIYFPDEVFSGGHPAKANMFMMLELIGYLTKEGDTILDPMAGTGSILLAAKFGRRVIAIDIESGYHALQKLATQLMEIEDRVVLLHGNCKDFLPIPVDHIIFSPPYGPIMKKTKKGDDWGGDITGDLYGTTVDEFGTYSSTPGNVGLENEFMYHQQMEKIYSRLYDCIPAGGTMTVITKDHMKKGKRIYLTERMKRFCFKVGFHQLEHHKRVATGSAFVKIYRGMGLEVVDDEDIVLFGKG